MVFFFLFLFFSTLLFLAYFAVDEQIKFIEFFFFLILIFAFFLWIKVV